MLAIVKELQKSLEVDDSFNNRQNIAHQLVGMGFGNDIVMTYQICQKIADLAESNQLTSIHNTINGITDFDAEYYWCNGYANYEDLTAGRLECLLYDLVTELEE